MEINGLAEPIDWDGPDGRRLEQLRARFLSGIPGPDYWNEPRTLELYDLLFAQRIRWKWEWALAQAEARLLSDCPAVAAAGQRRVIDFGAGTAMASRAFFARFAPAPGDQLWLIDRSLPALRLGAERLRQELGPQAEALKIHTSREAPPRSDAIWLVSHVLGELEPEAFETLANRLANASVALLVEPGTPRASEALVALRERLLPAHRALYPCPGNFACPLSKSGRQPSDWCHLFAPAAAEAFTTSLWRDAQQHLSIDLRSLPLSVLFLSRGPAPLATPLDPPDALRLLGRPKLEKGRMLLDLCGQGQLRRARLLDRDDRELTKLLRSGQPQHPLLTASIEADRLLLGAR